MGPDRTGPQRKPAADGEPPTARTPGRPNTSVDQSPAMLAQRKRLMDTFGDAAQLAEEPPAPNRTGMPDSLKTGIESMSGMDMSDVRVHRNSPQPKELSALAYAQGSDIHLGPGQEKHLPHEAWHLVQQRQGRVRPTTQMGGVSVNDDPSLEQEADTMGAKANASSAGSAAPMSASPSAQRATQRKESLEDFPADAGGQVEWVRSASDEERRELLADPEVAEQVQTVAAEQADQAKAQPAPAGASAAQDAGEHAKPIEVPAPEEEARMHGMSLETAKAKGVVQGFGRNQVAQLILGRPIRLAATAARALISTMVQAGSGGHGFTVRYNHGYAQQQLNGHDYQYATNGQGCIDFSNGNTAPGAHDPVNATYNIAGYFAAHNWDLRNFNRYWHFKAANAKRAGWGDGDNRKPPNGGSSPPNFTWHHDEQVGRMDLIDPEVHNAFKHRGGFAIWGS